MNLIRNTRLLYAVGNSLRSRLHECSIQIKNMLFRAHCCTLYANEMWCCFTNESPRCLRVSRNDSYRSIHDIPRYCSVRQYQVKTNIDTCDALVANFYSVL